VPKLVTVFAGSPSFAATILQGLSNSPHAPKAVLTQPDRARGRGRRVQANPVKQLAGALQLPVLQPANLRDTDAMDQLKALQPDLLIVAAYGLILPKTVLNLPTYGCLNVHASLLPRWRGAAPVERALMAGDPETGVCIMHMEAGLDTGPVYRCARTPIEPDSSAEELERRLAEMGAQELLTVVGAFADAHATQSRPPAPVAQRETGATYAHKLTAADRTLDWTRPAEELARQINALADRLPVRTRIADIGCQFLAATAMADSTGRPTKPAPGTLMDASKIGLFIQCATGQLQITSLRMEQGKGTPLNPAAAINGFGDLFRNGAQFA